MKKLLLLFLFITITSFANAQDAKPSKEETQKFLNNMLSSVIGNPQDSDQPTIRKIQKQSFTNDFSDYLRQNGDNEFRERDEYIRIPWQDFTDFIVITQKNDIQTIVRLIFKTKMEEKYFCCYVDEDNGIPALTFTTDQFLIFLPNDKVESCKKAILRLAEIAKEENKDPFKN